MVSLACVILGPSLCLADDGGANSIGGAIELIKGKHPSIHMVSEFVKIDRLPEGRVYAKFTFYNDGPATDVLMGFPASGYGEGRRDPQFLNGFRSWVDGKPIKTILRPATKQTGDDVKAWYVKTVHFAQGQTRVVEDRYTGGGKDVSDGWHAFTYILSTGASWKGPIGYAKIVCDLSGLRKYSPVTISTKGYKRQGSTAVWEFHNLKPEVRMHERKKLATPGDGRAAKEQGPSEIEVSWYPWFKDIEVDGANNGNAGYMGGSERAGQEVLMSASAAANLLGGSLVDEGRGRTRLTVGSRWVEFRVGSTGLASSDGKTYRIPRTPALLKENKFLGGESDVWVPLCAMARALGCKTRFEPSKEAGACSDRLLIDLPSDSADEGATKQPRVGHEIRVAPPPAPGRIKRPPNQFHPERGALCAIRNYDRFALISVSPLKRSLAGLSVTGERSGTPTERIAATEPHAEAGSASKSG